MFSLIHSTFSAICGMQDIADRLPHLTPTRTYPLCFSGTSRTDGHLPEFTEFYSFHNLWHQRTATGNGRRLHCACPKGWLLLWMLWIGGAKGQRRSRATRQHFRIAFKNALESTFNVLPLCAQSRGD